MAKGKKKDDEKKAALQARKEAKADKLAQKRIRKELGLPSVTTSITNNDDDDGDDDDDDKNCQNLDDLIEQYRKHDLELQANATTTIWKTLSGFPSPRGNASFTYVDDKNGYLYVFGGEYFDGIENLVMDELLRWDPSKQEWRQIITPPPHPAPRCAHSCVSYNKALYVFGGELANADQYHHYKDFWRFDTVTHKWEEIPPRPVGGSIPTARSGHTAFVWKHFMVLFGGFYEALKETKWFNDIYVFNMQTQTWMDVPHSKLSSRPEPRSACHIGILPDGAILHGGYSKLKASSTHTTTTSHTTTTASTSVREAKVHHDAWMLHLKPLLQGKPPTWERLSLRGAARTNASLMDHKNVTKEGPNRAGSASTTYKGKLMLVFGGVVDEEQANHQLSSVFYNDLFALDMENSKWFPIRPKPNSNTAGGNIRRRRRRRKKDSEQPETVAHAAMTQPIEVQEDNDDDDDDDLELDSDDEVDNVPSQGWDLTMLRSKMSSFIDGEGNVVYENIESATCYTTRKANDSDDDEEEDEEKEEEKEDDSCNLSKHRESHNSSSGPTTSLTPPRSMTRIEPLPRMNARIVVRNHILYIFGGILEVGDREVTLDDCWALDLRKRTHWECLSEGTIDKQVWRGAVYDDDDSYISTGTGAHEDSSDDEGDDLEDQDMNHEPNGHRLDDDESEATLTKAKMKKAAKNRESSRKQALKEQIVELKSNLDKYHGILIPIPDEPMAQYYTRTSKFWTKKATNESNTHGVPMEGETSIKARKREGFALAQQCYDEVKPILDRLKDLTLQSTSSSVPMEDSKTQKKPKTPKVKSKIREK
jgi:Domain of unknown function (DUF4110)/Galactose oxidase, central domain